MAFSGLQTQILALYRQCLREAGKKPVVCTVHFEPYLLTIPISFSLSNRFLQHTRKKFKAFARAEFDRYLKLDRRNFSMIEFLIRNGNKKLQLLRQDHVKDIQI